MPKLPSVRKHAKGYFFIRIQGKDHYLGSDKPQANAQAKLLLADYLRDQPVSRSSRAGASEMAIEEIAVEFLLDEKKKFEHSDHDTGSYDRARRAVQLLIDSFGKTKPSDFGPLALKQIRQQLIDQGLARTTINTRVNIIKSCFRFAVENEYCEPSAYHTLQAVKGLQKGRSAAKDGKKVLPVSVELVNKTLPELPPIIADIVRLQVYCGARCSELLNLRAGEIDMSKEIWRYVPKDGHKSSWRGKERVVYFGPHCQEILKPYLERVGDDMDRYLFSPRDSVRLYKEKRRAARKTSVQPSQQNRAKENPKKVPGKRYNRHSYRNAILRACERLGIEHWFPYQLRHLSGTLAREVEGLDGAQHFLGHSNAKVTEIYAELRDEKTEAVARKIG